MRDDYSCGPDAGRNPAKRSEGAVPAALVRSPRGHCMGAPGRPRRLPLRETGLSGAARPRVMVACGMRPIARAGSETSLGLLLSRPWRARVCNQNSARVVKNLRKHHDLDNPDPRRDLHRHGDQRLSAGRILTGRFRPQSPEFALDYPNSADGRPPGVVKRIRRRFRFARIHGG